MKVSILSAVRLFLCSVTLFATRLPFLSAATSTNHSPEVAIVFPPSGVLYRSGTYIHIRARASDDDGQIVAVQFYADSKLLGTVTNAPYILKWYGDPGWYVSTVLTAVAVDNLGATNVSAPVIAGFGQAPILENSYAITSPPFKGILPATIPFVFAARLVGSNGSDTPAVFFVGTNVVGTAADPPYSVIVTNVAEGDYVLSVVPPNASPESGYGFITVVPLLIQQQQLAANGGFSFVAAGRVAGKATVIEASTNLLTWQPIATNLTSTNSFLFIDPQATNFSRRFYRASFKE